MSVYTTALKGNSALAPGSILNIPLQNREIKLQFSRTGIQLALEMFAGDSVAKIQDFVERRYRINTHDLTSNLLGINGSVLNIKSRQLSSAGGDRSFLDFEAKKSGLDLLPKKSG